MINFIRWFKNYFVPTPQQIAAKTLHANAIDIQLERLEETIREIKRAAQR